MNRLLIDSSNMLSVALHKGKDPHAYEVDGEMIPTWQHGYNNFLQYFKYVLDDLEMSPRQAILVLDAPKSRAMRQQIYRGYKAHRKPKSPAFLEELNTLSKEMQIFIRQLGGTVAMAKGMEADDLICALANTIENSVVLSTDVDLIFPGSYHYIKKAHADEEDCGDAYLPGLNRKYIPLYRALVGDTKDFGPGMSAKGFGEKSFLKFWATYGDAGLDELITHIEGSGELPDTLEKSATEIRTAYRLAQWIPVPYYRVKWEPGFARGPECSSYDMEFGQWYQNKTLVIAGVFSEGLKELIREQTKEAPFISIDIETSDVEESEAWLKNIKQNFSKPPINIDVKASELAGLSITVGDNLQHTYYFPVDHADTDNVSSEELKDFILSLSNDFIAHNAPGFELPVLKDNWDAWLPNCHCSKIAASYVNENHFTNGLKPLTYEHFQYHQATYKEVTQGRKMNELTGLEAFDYGCDDTIVTGGLMNHFITVMQFEGSFNAYLEVEQDAMYMTASAFVDGVTTDLPVLEKLHDADKKEYDKHYEILSDYLIATGHDSVLDPTMAEFSAKEIKRAYHILTGEKFKTNFRNLDKVIEKMPAGGFKGQILRLCYDDNHNEWDFDGPQLAHLNKWLKDNYTTRVDFKVNSPTQVPKLLYEHMKCPVKWRNNVTKTQRKKGIKEGIPSGDDDSIKWAAKFDATPEQAKALKALQRCRSFLTRNGLYYSSYKHLVHWSDGKLRSNLKQSNTTSRRFAPAGPNVNQMPKRNEEGRKVRQCVVPHAKDCVIVAPDFSSQELRHSANACLDENFLACYTGDDLKDLHSLTAFEICQRQGKEFDTYEELAMALGDSKHPLHKVAKAYRTAKAKQTNFLSQYISVGGGVDTLSKDLQITEEEAIAFLDAKSSAFPGVDVWKEEYTELIATTHKATTLLGAVRHIHDGLVRGAGKSILRSGVNFHIQSSSAEQVKIVMGKIWAASLLQKYGARFYFPVHDELVFSVPMKNLMAFCTELRPLMEFQYANMLVPCVSSLAVGHNFGQLDEIPWEDTEKWLMKAA